MKLALQIFIFSLLFGFYSQTLHAECVNQPQASTLNALANKKAFDLVNSKNSLALMPFFDISNPILDPLLAESMPYAFYDILATHLDNVYHPYLTQDLLTSLGISGYLLAEKSTAEQVAKALKARFVVYGSVQRTIDNQMRFFITIYDDKTKENIHPVFQFVTDLNDLFFSQLKMGLTTLSKPLSISPSDLKSSQKIPKLQAFRYYARGMSYAKNYDEAQLNMATVWFEKALKESYYDYPDAAREMARAHYMQALLMKLSGQNPSQNWLLAKQHALEFAKINQKKPSPKDQFMTRFIHNEERFTNGVNFYKNGQKSKAQNEALNGLKEVPEDGQMAWLLSLTGGDVTKISKTELVCFE